MKVVDAIAEILARGGGISRLLSDQCADRSRGESRRPAHCLSPGKGGVGIADGFTRVNNGRRIGVIHHAGGPGAENAFSGITTAYSDSVPVLCLPVGHPRNTSPVYSVFARCKPMRRFTKWTEEITVAGAVPEIMRRAFSYLKMGRPRSGTG